MRSSLVRTACWNAEEGGGYGYFISLPPSSLFHPVMSNTISSPTAIRSSLGPLTTTFTPPQECTIWGAIGTSSSLYGLWNGEGCVSSSILDTSTCWPAIASSVSVPRGAANGRGFYSPGLACPSGHTAACTAAQLPNGVPSPILSGNSFDFQFPLEPGETAIGCCPS